MKTKVFCGILLITLSACGVQEQDGGIEIPFKDVIGLYNGSCGEIDNTSGIITQQEDASVNVIATNMNLATFTPTCERFNLIVASYLGKEDNLLRFESSINSISIAYFIDNDSLAIRDTSSANSSIFTGKK